MAPRVRLRELLLLVSAASVPLSLALTPWPPPQIETIVVQGPGPDCACGAASEQCAPPFTEPPDEPTPEPEAIEAAPQPEAAAGIDFLWVTDGHDDAGPVIVLSLDPDPSWAAGPPRVVDDHGVAIRPLDEAALPAGLRAVIGRRVEAITDAGEVCAAVVGAPQLVADAEGDLDMLVDMDASGDGDPGDVEAADALLPGARRTALARAVWREGRRLLVAPLAVEPGCAAVEGLRWARSPGQGAVDVLRGGGSEAPRASLLRRFLALPEIVELAQEFDEFHAHARRAAPEPSGDDAAAPALRDHVRAQDWRRGDAVAAITVATEGDVFTVEACNTLVAPRWGIATVDGDGKVGRVHAAPSSDLIAVLDVDGDGQLELFVGSWDGAVRLLGVTPTGVVERSVLPPRAWYGCPC